MKIARLRDSREDMDLKQLDVAKSLGVHFSTVSGWENGQDTIPLRQLIKYANKYHLSLDYLFGLTKNNNYTELDINLKKIGNRLKKFRKKKGLTQYQIAEKLNTGQSAYSHYENGRYLITTSFLYTLLKLYKNISADDIFKK